LQWLLDLSYIHDNNLNNLYKLADIQEQKQGIAEIQKFRCLKPELQSLQKWLKQEIRDKYKGTNALKKVHQPKNNQIMDEKGNLLADFCSILNRLKNYLHHLLYIGLMTLSQLHYITAQL